MEQKIIWMMHFYKATILSVAILALMQGCVDSIMTEKTYIFENATDHVITITGYFPDESRKSPVEYAKLDKKGGYMD